MIPVLRHTTRAAALAACVLHLALAPKASAERLDARFEHPLGFYFAHPSSWSQQALGEEVLALVPSDVMLHEGQPAEIFLVLGDDAGGLDDPAAPEVVRVAEQIVAASLPFLQRDGEVESRSSSGYRSAVLTWKGTSPTQLEVRARMWVRMLEGSVIALFAATPVERFASREPVVEQIFASFGYTKPQGDERLFGRWRYTSTYMSGDFSMVSERYLTLNPDGTCYEGGQLMGGMSHSDDSGGYTGDTRASSGRGADASGRWRTANKTITMEWESGQVEEWEYIVSGGDMMFRRGETKRLWKRLH